MQFDFIIGNPPFGGSVKKSRKTGVLHSLILERIFYSLKFNGQMSMVHPATWRSRDRTTTHLADIYFNNTTRATLHDQMLCRYIWNIESTLDEVQVTRNGIPKIEVAFDDLSIERGKEPFVDVTEWALAGNPIPTRHFEHMKRLLACGKGRPIEISRPLTNIKPKMCKKEKDNEYKYPILLKIKKEPKFNEGVFYTNNPPDKKPKIILGWGSKYNLLDLEGEYQSFKNSTYHIYGTKEELKLLYRGMINPIFPLMLRTFTGVGQIVVWDTFNRNLPILTRIKMDFTEDFEKMIEKYNLNQEMFWRVAGDVKRSGKYDDYVNIAKLAPSWAEHSELEK